MDSWVCKTSHLPAAGQHTDVTASIERSVQCIRMANTLHCFSRVPSKEVTAPGCSQKSLTLRTEV